MHDRLGFYGFWTVGAIIACLIFESLWPLVAIALAILGLEYALTGFLVSSVHQRGDCAPSPLPALGSPSE